MGPRSNGTRLIFMDEGAVVEDGDPTQIFNDPQHPRTQDFFSKLLSHM